MIKSPTELQKYLKYDVIDVFDLEYSEFQQAMEKYDEKYFEDKMIVMVLLEEIYCERSCSQCEKKNEFVA